MPPYEQDCSGFTFAIRDEHGNWYPMENIRELSACHDNQEKNCPDFMTGNVDFEFKLCIRNIRGLYDYVFRNRPWTNSAKRYVRSLKRWKEKERRRRLKHEARICSDVR